MSNSPTGLKNERCQLSAIHRCHAMAEWRILYMTSGVVQTACQPRSGPPPRIMLDGDVMRW